MDELIYYPGFEVKQMDWLKFALLYIDKLCPIIPMSGDSRLSNLSKHIINDTDLISIHRPDTEEGSKATLDALEYVDKILRTPQRYSAFFGQDFLETWRQSVDQNFTIFNAKYTPAWEDYCLEYQLGEKCDDGVRVHEQLAFIYMTLLAQVIGDSKGISPITDDRKLDSYSIVARRPSNSFQKQMSLARGTLQFKLPANLSHIDIDSIINLRNTSQFKQNLTAFHYELDRFLSHIEQETTPNIPDAFVDSLGSAWNDFADNILVLGPQTVQFGLGVWLTVGSTTATGAEFVKEIAGGLTLAVGAIVSVRSTWKHTSTKRNTRKYLADISELA